jgi:hypothetical protein
VSAEDRVFHAAQVRPGDRVLLTCADAEWSHDQRAEIVEGLQQRFPGVTFTVISGVSGIAVQPRELGNGA